MSVNPAHLEEVLDLEPLIRFVRGTIAFPSRSDADRVRHRSGVGASPHDSWCLANARLGFVYVTDRLD